MLKTNKLSVLASSLVLTLSFMSGQIEISGDIISNTTWNADNEYLLVGQTFVQAGVTLTIEAGTTIKALPDDGFGFAPALIVLQDAYLIADGTADAPITFTSALPESELPLRGTWGGLILLGNAPISADGGTDNIEGLFGIPFGGTNPDDSSGILRYVRVWYGGAVIGEGNEINGITFGGVGRGTVVENCEVAWNLDDGFEFFGGTVDVRNLSVLFVGDDMFDTDEGYQGRGQNLFGLIGSDAGNRGFEMDSKTDGDMNSQPRSYPNWTNITLIGSGDPAVNADNDQIIRWREGTGGHFTNMIVAEGKALGIRVTDDATLNLIPDSLYLSPNAIVYDCATGQFGGEYGFTALDTDPVFMMIEGRETGGIIDPRPHISGAAWQDIDVVEEDDFFVQTDYKGAFGEEMWLEGYSWLAEFNRLGGDYQANGDVSLDGSTDVLDIVLVVGYILGTEGLSGAALISIDANMDGAVDILDVVLVVSWILSGRTDTAAEASFEIRGSSLVMEADGFVGGVQAVITHNSDFSISLQHGALVADYNTVGNHTTVILVAPENGVLFTGSSDFEIVNVVAASSDGYIAVGSELATAFNLGNAYPNPFNPGTTFSYEISADSNVSIAVYDIQGRMVQELVNSSHTAGTYSYTWQPKGVAGGAYIIQMTAGDTKLARKVMLVK